MKPVEIVFLILLLFVGVYIRYTHIFLESVWVDETVYMWQGYKLLYEPSLLLTSDYYGNTPFPLIFIAFFNLFTDNRFVAGRLAVYFFSLIGILLAFLLGKEVKDEYAGFLAGLLVTVNPLHWFLGTRALMDLPEATMVSLAAYALLRFERRQTKATFGMLLLAVAFTALTKVPGFLVVPGILLYYLLKALASPKRTITYLTTQLKEKRFAAGACFAIGIVSFFTWTKWGLITGFLKSIAFRHAFLNHLPFMFTTTILFFLGLSIFLIAFYREWKGIALLTIFLTFFATFSLLPAEPDPRHIAPIIPLGIVLAVFSYFEMGSLMKLFVRLPFEWGLLIVGIIFAFSLHEQGTQFILNKTYTFTGYNEAGQWLADNLPRGALAYVSSQGPMRLFSGLGYNDENGPLRQIQTFGEGTDPDFSKATLPIVLHIDQWERGPLWSFPFTEEKLGKLEAKGFRVEKVVFRKYPTQQGLQDMPVHFLLVKRQ